MIKNLPVGAGDARDAGSIPGSGRCPGWGFPGGSVVKNPPANAGDLGSILDLGRFHMPQSN